MQEKTLKELIKMARGDRTMEQFSAATRNNKDKGKTEKDISASKLYRLADGRLRRSINRKDLEAIAEAADESVVSDKEEFLEELIKASQVLKKESDDRVRDIARYRYAKESALEITAREAITQILLETYGEVSIVIPPKSSIHDFEIDIRLENGESQALFFEVKSVIDNSFGSLGVRASIGNIMNWYSEYEECDWYYIVYLDVIPSKENAVDIDAVNRLGFNDIKENVSVPLNISVLSVYDLAYESTTTRFSICELPISSTEKPDLTISSTSFEDRTKKFAKGDKA